MANPTQAVMPPDFADAHERHWQDARSLSSAGRLPNADHLYGFSAECGLKALMVCFGMTMGTDGPVDRKDREHIDRLFQRYESYRSNSRHPSAAAYTITSTTAFDDWHASQRYANGTGSHSPGSMPMHKRLVRFAPSSGQHDRMDC
ncbi:hypothetical protein ACFQ4K_31330 [Tistrella bauzanensis]